EPRRGNPGSCSADCKGRGGTVEFHRSSLVLHAGGALLEAPFDDQQPAAIVREYTAAQKSETSVPATGMSASISISAPSSVNQHASTLYSSIVSRWESTAPRIRSRLAASTTASTLSPLWYRIVISIAVLPPAFEVIVQRQEEIGR